MILRNTSLIRLACASVHRTSILSFSIRGFSSSISRMASDVPGSAPAPAPAGDPAYKPRYIDIGINLADPIFRGRYHGHQRHPDDLSAVISRAQEVGCEKMIITGSDFPSSRHALEIAKEYPGIVYTTAGIHPCSSSIFSATHPFRDGDDHTTSHTPPCPAPAPDQTPDQTPDTDPTEPTPDAARTTLILHTLQTLITTARATHPNALVAFGEFGLDYERLHYCPRPLQLHSFTSQLRLASTLSPPLPLFLHSRAAHADFVACLQAAFGPKLENLKSGGVVHSFTGTSAEAAELVELGLYVGANGCSFKTPENCEVVRGVRLGRLMLETDGPWCEVRPSHAGWRYLIEPRPSDPNPNPNPNPDSNAAGADADGVTEANADGGRAARKKKKQAELAAAQRKKAEEVPDRFPVVKKEKWVEGAMVKGRNEPCSIERVGRVVAGIKGVDVREVCEAAWRNTVEVFGLEE
ncbi:hypothetical protein F5B20DRAFT_547293 [Whalleya microplaca]|nr:hypothetical protein F5B20DRAFT_547293 [Whalleya microplaca]